MFLPRTVLRWDSSSKLPFLSFWKIALFWSSHLPRPPFLLLPPETLVFPKILSLALFSSQTLPLEGFIRYLLPVCLQLPSLHLYFKALFQIQEWLWTSFLSESNLVLNPGPVSKCMTLSSFIQRDSNSPPIRRLSKLHDIIHMKFLGRHQVNCQ